MILTVQRIIHAYHPNLAETQCRIGAIFGRNDNGPAIKVHGCAALAAIQAVSAKRRPHCEYDAEILIDQSEWNRLSPQQQDALIDHELSHLRRKEHKPKKLAKLREANPECPAWKLDNLGRPVLGTVPADFTPGDCFAAVIARHGFAAVEYIGAKRFAEFAEDAMRQHKAGKDR